MAEEQIDLTIRGSQLPRLAAGFELAEHLIAFMGWSVGDFNHSVQPVMSAMISIQSKLLDRLNVPSYFVRDDPLRLAKSCSKSVQEMLRCFYAPVCFSKKCPNHCHLHQRPVTAHAFTTDRENCVQIRLIV